MQRRALKTAAVLMLSLGMLSAPAAADRKNYAASECVKYSIGGTMLYSYSSIGNTHTADALFVDCPIVKDGGGAGSAWIHVTDRNSAQAVECTLVEAYVVNTDNLYYYDSEGQASVGDTTAVQELTYGGLATNASSYLYLSCRIPPKSGSKVSSLETYSMDEE